MLKHYRKDPEVLAGVFFVFLLVTSFMGEAGLGDNGFTVEGIKNDVLNSKAIKKLEIFPQINRLATESIFGPSDGKLSDSA
jgi:hypothetical protein